MNKDDQQQLKEIEIRLKNKRVATHEVWGLVSDIEWLVAKVKELDNRILVEHIVSNSINPSSFECFHCHEGTMRFKEEQSPETGMLHRAYWQCDKCGRRNNEPETPAKQPS